MKKIKITVIVETILLMIFVCISCFSFNQIRKNTKIEKKLDSCLSEKSGLKTDKDSLIVENKELTKQNNELNAENEKLKKEIKTLKKN